MNGFFVRRNCRAECCCLWAGKRDEPALDFQCKAIGILFRTHTNQFLTPRGQKVTLNAALLNAHLKAPLVDWPHPLLPPLSISHPPPPASAWVKPQGRSYFHPWAVKKHGTRDADMEHSDQTNCVVNYPDYSSKSNHSFHSKLKSHFWRSHYVGRSVCRSVGRYMKTFFEHC